MTTTADLLILGGGIAGYTVALAAAERGLSSIILDVPRPGAASRAAAGMLAPSLEELPPGMLPHAIAARDFYPKYLSALGERTGLDVPLDRSGILRLLSAGELDAPTAAHSGAERLDTSALAGLEPSFAGHPGAVLHPHDGAVDNVALMESLEHAIGQTPAIQRVGAEILSIDVQQRSALTRTRGRYFGSSLVLATGAWAAKMPGLPRPVPVRPVRGQLLRLGGGSRVRHVTYVAGGYLVPRGDSVLVGATSEEAGFENETSLAGLATLRHIAVRAIPSLAGALVVDHWAGLRPMSSDSHPILGADPVWPALIYACGYSRNGILFAPWAAAQLAALASGEAAPALDAFAITRPGLTTSVHAI
ncbi:MAG: FAD-dependent oxidoreductase [Gemmatimonadaceae bacterium]